MIFIIIYEHGNAFENFCKLYILKHKGKFELHNRHYACVIEAHAEN